MKANTLSYMNYTNCSDAHYYITLNYRNCLEAHNNIFRELYEMF